MSGPTFFPTAARTRDDAHLQSRGQPPKRTCNSAASLASCFSLVEEIMPTPTSHDTQHCVGPGADPWVLLRTVASFLLALPCCCGLCCPRPDSWKSYFQRGLPEDQPAMLGRSENLSVSYQCLLTKPHASFVRVPNCYLH